MDKAIACTIPGIKFPPAWWVRLNLSLVIFDWWVSRYESGWAINGYFISQPVVRYFLASFMLGLGLLVIRTDWVVSNLGLITENLTLIQSDNKTGNNLIRY